MQFDQLKALVSVAQHNSFSDAANALNLTQPAVTKRIQALEEAAGSPAFDRVGRRVIPTPAGKILIAQARKILALVDDTMNQLSTLAESVAGSLSLATSHHIGLHRLAPVLQHFVADYPEVKLNVTFEDSEVAHELVRRGEVELAVVTLNPEGDQRLLSWAVWDDPLVFVANEPSDAESLEDLAQKPCVLPGLSTYTGKIVTQRFAKQGIVLTPAMSTNYLETIGMLVQVGLGWSVLPRSMSSGLFEMNIDCEPMSRTLGVVTHPDRATSSAAAAFVDVLLNQDEGDAASRLQ